MTDERVRRAERALGAGAAEAEERLLRERLRAGQLDPLRLRLAAFLGHGAARALDPAAPRPPELARAWAQAAARGTSGPLPFPVVQRLAATAHVRAWCETLAELGLEALIRAGALGLKEAAAACPGPLPAEVTRPLDAVRAWLERPDASRAAACLEVAEELALENLQLDPADPHSGLRQGSVLLAYAVEALVPASAAQGVATALLQAGRSARQARGSTPPAGDEPALPAGLPEVLEAVRVRLLTWALG